MLDAPGPLSTELLEDAAACHADALVEFLADDYAAGRTSAGADDIGLAVVAETALVTGQAPLLEVGRTGVADYVTEDEMANLPISDRDFVRFALLSRCSGERQGKGSR